MSDELYLFPRYNPSLPGFDDHASWVTAAGEEARVHHGLLSDISLDTIKSGISVVLPGELVSWFKTSVPGSNREKILQAIPYAIEDNLVDDVEELHFSINKDDSAGEGGNDYQVVVVKKSILQDLLSKLKLHHISPDRVIPDFSLLQDQEKVLLVGNKVMVNLPEVKMTCLQESFQQIEKQLDNPEVEEINDGYELHLLNQGVPNSVVNLLQGGFTKVKSWSGVIKKWTPVAALLLVWVITESVLFGIDYFRLDKQNQELNTRINAIYKQSFPESKRIVNAHVQMKQKLAELKRKKGQSGSSFAEMLAGTAEVLSASPGLVIKSLRYYDGRINLEITLSSLQALDALKQSLVKKKGYKVEIQNASAEKEHVKARVQIQGRVS